jgi:hypothetical protein
MPPKEKPQPAESQIALLHWWISNGADFTRKVKEIPQPEKIKPLLLALQKVPELKRDLTAIPTAAVEKANDRITGQLKEKGVVVLPVAQNSNYLMANFVTHSKIANEDLQLLLSLKKQLIWLKLSYTNINDSAMKSVAQLQNLTRLSLDHTSISDNGVLPLNALANLNYLNLVDTKVTAKGILRLKELKSLLSLFLYQTKVNKEDWAALQNAFPKTRIDSGGYFVETFASDTMQVKAKKY